MRVIECFGGSRLHHVSPSIFRLRIKKDFNLGKKSVCVSYCVGVDLRVAVHWRENICAGEGRAFVQIFAKQTTI